MKNYLQKIKNLFGACPTCEMAAGPDGSVCKALPPKEFFASRSGAEHLLRGVIGVGALALGVWVARDHPWMSIALGGITILAWRGCPLCWTVGLWQTLSPDTAPKFKSGVKSSEKID